MAYIICANPGSESRKYSLYKDSSLLLSLHLEKSVGSFISTNDFNAKSTEEKITEEQFGKSANYLLSVIKQKLKIESSEISAVGVRIVAPGKYFTTHKPIDDTFIANFKQKLEISPLHIQASLSEIEMFKQALPETQLFCISDSAYHANRPEVSRLYAVPKQMRDSLEAERFGYHGLSAEYAISELKRITGAVPEKTVVCHMGGGISIMAFKAGRTVDTSMGFSPLEGVMMATRSGNIDPVLVCALMEKTKSGATLVETFLNKGCGLAGLSGVSEDPRDLIKAESEGNKGARTALGLYVYRIKKEIGAMSAILNGIDCLVFTGTVGERSSVLRARICEDMNYLGVGLDESKNTKQKSGTGEIGGTGSKTRIFALKTDEMKVMSDALLKML